MRDVYAVRLSPRDASYFERLAQSDGCTAGEKLDALIRKCLRHEREDEAALALHVKLFGGPLFGPQIDK